MTKLEQAAKAYRDAQAMVLDLQGQSDRLAAEGAAIGRRLDECTDKLETAIGERNRAGGALIEAAKESP